MIACWGEGALTNKPKFELITLLFNISLGACHLILGALSESLWLLTLGTYYLILGVARFLVLKSIKNYRTVKKLTGFMLMIMSAPLAGSVILSVLRDRGYELHMIIMIGLAAYAFTKVTLATVDLIKSRRAKSDKLVAIRSISFADALVSIFALQRSMLVSFEGMSESEIRIMNATIGSAVCVAVFFIGFHLFGCKFPFARLKKHIR